VANNKEVCRHHAVLLSLRDRNQYTKKPAILSFAGFVFKQIELL